MPVGPLQRIRYIAKVGWKKRLRDVMLFDGVERWWVAREDLARRYLQGEGIEIGAFTWPMRVPKGASVKYLDHAPRDELIRGYGDTFGKEGTNGAMIPETDIVDDGEVLAKVADESQDFVIANHVLEHMPDPIKALGHWLRVLRPGGILFLSLPDGRHTFDRFREPTTLEHLLRDHAEGPEVSRWQHYREWAKYIEGRGDETLDERAAEYEAIDERNHFHVWTADTFLGMLPGFGLPCTVEAAQRTQHDFVCILAKTA